MSIKTILDTLDEEVSDIHSTDFEVEVIETKYVPSSNDPSLTFENFDSKRKKVKIIETCVLYIDIRKSTTLNLQHYPKTMAKLYSSFIRSMIKAAEYYGCKVRNVVGDRVMVIYDSEKCFSNAVNTAILMNTISKTIINKHFKNNTFSCGIGIDYGKMMVTKCGTVKYGSENAHYKSLVWLGKPANIASKLTDEANKQSTYRTEKGFKIGLHYPYTDKWLWQFQTNEELVKNIEFYYTSPHMEYKNEHFSSFHTATQSYSNNNSTPPILMTSEVYTGFKTTNPDAASIKNGWWKKQSRTIPDYSGVVYGGDLTFPW